MYTTVCVCACVCMCVYGRLCKYASKCRGQEVRLKYYTALLTNQRCPRGFWPNAALWTINLDLRRNTFVSVPTSRMSVTCCIGLVLLTQPGVLFSVEFNKSLCVHPGCRSLNAVTTVNQSRPLHQYFFF